ncbi:Amino acid/polyamine transporter I [Penicillium cosmopolitanum]|uniref:Amino acid/polyamine transporter I n=1 Tax=Penicillium cosmopolitanum TaxID=1131564 RepID=A0A9X0B9F5_9EURO|nr:Amino acid/polyamine transporter I [Penicillium cosmopolitanum]KAJ5396617.1 Amino acid/polyamine transporter I [Penicillium cosmopolitanum]
MKFADSHPIIGNTQSAVNYMLSELSVFNVDFPTDSSSVKFRAVQWICTEVLLALAALMNLASPRVFKYIFWFSTGAVFLDFILNVIWLPVGAHNTYGLRTAQEAFMTTYNGTGAPAGWNWCLSYLATAGILIGFDASGHVAEETKNASVNAAKVILFLFTSPPIDVLFSYDAPQPFVPLYAAVLGRGGHIVMNVLSVVALWLNTAIAVTAASRLVFAVARDGVLLHLDGYLECQQKANLETPFLSSGVSLLSSLVPFCLLPSRSPLWCRQQVFHLPQLTG